MFANLFRNALYTAGGCFGRQALARVSVSDEIARGRTVTSASLQASSARVVPWVVGAFLIAGSTFLYGQTDGAAPVLIDDAIRDRNAPAVKTLISAGADVNSPGLLAFAVLRGGVEIVKLLVDAGADVNVAMPVPPEQEEGLRTVFGSSAVVVGLTPLSVAALRGHFEAAEILLEEGADANVVTVSGTPVGMAATMGHTDVLRLLIDSGGDASGRRLTGTAAVMFSPLLLAATAGQIDAMELLVRSGGYRCPDHLSSTMGDIAYRAALDRLFEEAGSHEMTALMDRAREACGVK